MKRRITLAVAVVAAFALALCLAGCSGSSQNYTPTEKTQTVSDSQLVKAGTLTVGVNASNPPLAGQTSKYVGIDVDVAAALADEMGLKLSIVDVKNDPETALNEGKIDVALGVDKSATSTSTTAVAMWKSDTYVQTGIALFSTKASATVPTTAAEAANVKFSAQASSVSAWNITNQFGASSLVSTTDLSSTFENLINGTVDFAVADAVVGMYAAHTAGQSVYIVGMVTAPTGYCAAVAGKNTAMQSTITTTLKTITSNGMVGLIEKKWLGTTLSLGTLPVTATTMAPVTTNTNTTNTNTDEADAADVANAVADAVTNASAA